ncbi:MAG TPA: hypothetical protein VHJ20_11890 [Polyangia bacterium]|nr:hypothetical protein [Polyangia bacterium]
MRGLAPVRALATLLALAGGAACGDAPVVFVGSASGTPLDVPPTWQEHWFEHTQLLKLATNTDALAVYVDADVDVAKASALLPFLGSLWTYTVAHYGSMGAGRLYVVLHQGRYLGCHEDHHFSALHDGRDVIDCGFTSFDDLTKPVFLVGHVAANLVESTADDRDSSPALPLWQDSKWAEFYQYDVYRAAGETSAADTLYAQWTADNWVDDFPVAGTHWFRDWFYPLWRDDGGVDLMARFFASLAKNFPRSTTDPNGYARAMNWGEFIHFMSGAAGRDLKPLATTAFHWPAAWDALYAQARTDFPQITY